MVDLLIYSLYSFMHSFIRSLLLYLVDGIAGTDDVGLTNCRFGLEVGHVVLQSRDDG